MPKEEFLQFVWKFGLFNKEELHTTKGEKVEVLSLGTHNSNAGADFFNAQIKIGETTWAGNVEVHSKSSDWVLHKHNTDKAYNNVVLHVVDKCDTNTPLENGNSCPTVELAYPIDLEQRYTELTGSPTWSVCRPFVSTVDSFQLRSFLSRVLVDRLEVKSQRLTDVLSQTNNDWAEAFHRTLFRSFGFSINAVPFELLAQQTPLSAIAKHRSSLLQLEALLFGQAGFLDEAPLDSYHASLKAEYAFLQNKFQLKPIEKHLWKFMRLRPNNFPTIRIAQLAYLLHKSSNLIDAVLSLSKLEDYVELFNIKTSEYWETHYTFGTESRRTDKQLGRQSTERIITNTIVPYLFTYGQLRANEALQEKAFSLLEALPPEKNSIVDKWAEMGLKADNAFFSQALLQLTAGYCEKKRCPSCLIGRQMIIKKE